MTDRSYACLAAGLADAIARNWRQYRAATRVRPAPRRTVHGAARFGPRANGRTALQPPT